MSTVRTELLAEKIIEKIMEHLKDRKGFDNWYERIDTDIQEEIKRTLIDLCIDCIDEG